VAHDVFIATTGEVVDRLIAIPPELGRVVVDVRTIPEDGGWLPLAFAEPQSAGEVVQLRAAFIDAGILHGE
jgi:hypothetical protein